VGIVALLHGHTAQARQMLRKLLAEPMAVTPFVEGTRRGFRFEGRLVLDRLVSGEVANSLSASSSSRRDASIWKTFLPTVTSLAEWTRPARRQLFDRTSARPRPCLARFSYLCCRLPNTRVEGGLLVRPANAVGIRQLLIVSRSEPERYAYLQYVFDQDNGEVILDRRRENRRGRQAPVSAERRHGDRRQRDVSADLRVFGWALLRYEAKSS
jgi:hypothetical protein